MSCHSCGIIPPFLLVSIRDHVAANPEFYEELSTDPVPGVEKFSYDRKAYFNYWNTSVPEKFKMSAHPEDLETERQKALEDAKGNQVAAPVEARAPQHTSSDGKREADDNGQERSMGVSSYSAAAAEASVGWQMESDSSDEDSSSSDGMRRGLVPGDKKSRTFSDKNEDSVKSEDLIGKLQRPSWYTDWDVAAQRGAVFISALGGVAAVAAGAAAGFSGGLASAGVATAAGGSPGAILGGLLGAGAVNETKAKAKNLIQSHLASEDLGAYFSEKYCHQIFISDAKAKATRMDSKDKTDTGSSIECESPFPRTLAGIQARSNNLAAERTYKAIERTLAFLAKRFTRNSIDGKGQLIIASIHYPREDGHRKLSNAFWEPGKQQMVIGDGDGRIFNKFGFDLTAIAHEVIHGMTQHTIGIKFKYQSGALDEHISDVFAILVKNQNLWKASSQQIDGDRIWYIGEDLVRQEFKQKLTQSPQDGFFHALRSMKAPGSAYRIQNDRDKNTMKRADQPSKDPQVSHWDDYVRWDKEYDHGGVHINSGIPNKAFYLFATSVGEKALKTAGKVWYATITSRGLRPNAQFIDFANETLRNVEPTNLPALQKAWRDVGIAV